jgi:hypothetical protein
VAGTLNAFGGEARGAANGIPATRQSQSSHLARATACRGGESVSRSLLAYEPGGGICGQHLRIRTLGASSRPKSGRRPKVCIARLNFLIPSTAEFSVGWAQSGRELESESPRRGMNSAPNRGVDVCGFYPLMACAQHFGNSRCISIIKMIVIFRNVFQRCIVNANRHG